MKACRSFGVTCDLQPSTGNRIETGVGYGCPEVLCQAELIELLAIAARESQSRAVSQHHDVFAMKQRVHLLDVLAIDDGGTADAHEAFRRQLRLEGRYYISTGRSIEPYVMATVGAGTSYSTRWFTVRCAA